MLNYVIAALLVIVLVLIPIVGHTAADLDGLVIYLPMDEGQGNVAEDLSPLGVNDGKLIQDAKFVPNGKHGGAVELDGKGGSFVDMPWHDSMDVGADDFSTEIWFNYDEGGECRKFNMGIQCGWRRTAVLD